MNEIFKPHPRPNNWSSCSYKSDFTKISRRCSCLLLGYSIYHHAIFVNVERAVGWHPQSCYTGLQKKKKKNCSEKFGTVKKPGNKNFSLNHFIKGVRAQKLKGFLRWFINMVFLKKLSFSHRYPVNIPCFNLNKLKLTGLQNINNNPIVSQHVLIKQQALPKNIKHFGRQWKNQICQRPSLIRHDPSMCRDGQF